MYEEILIRPYGERNLGAALLRLPIDRKIDAVRGPIEALGGPWNGNIPCNLILPLNEEDWHKLEPILCQRAYYQDGWVYLPPRSRKGWTERGHYSAAYTSVFATSAIAGQISLSTRYTWEIVSYTEGGLEGYCSRPIYGHVLRVEYNFQAMVSYLLSKGTRYLS